MSQEFIEKCSVYNDVLKQYFGYSKLKDKQSEIIYNLLEKKEMYVVF